MMRENRTLKRALTDPRILSGIGNAYSDEILHAAQMSPIALTHKLDREQWERLYSATRATLESGYIVCAARRNAHFPKRSPPFGKRWRCMDASAKHVRDAARKFSASATPTTKRTTAFDAKREENCSRIARCPDC